MIRRVAVVAALAVLVLAGTPVAAQPRGPGREGFEARQHGWLSSLAEGKEAAKTTGKPLMVVLRCVP